MTKNLRSRMKWKNVFLHQDLTPRLREKTPDGRGTEKKTAEGRKGSRHHRKQDCDKANQDNVKTS